jgi:hypothetical protein
MSRHKLLCLAMTAGCFALAAGDITVAQAPLTPLPLPGAIAAPKDTPYPGTIRLAVDATKEQALDALAVTAANIQLRPGREWKSLQDTTNDPIIAMRRAIPSRSADSGECGQ